MIVPVTERTEPAPHPGRPHRHHPHRGFGSRRHSITRRPHAAHHPSAAPAASAGTPGGTALTHHLLPTPAGRTHAVQQGDQGPLVLLLHGFPEPWYAWRHQLPVLAAAGYRAVAIDVRGYGRSPKPESVDGYRMLDLVADNVAVVEALGERSVVVVGHDWGASIAAVSALTRPDAFRAVGLLSVPYTPPGGPRPSEVFRRWRGTGPETAPGGVLRLVLPAAGPRGGRDRARRAGVARRLLRGPVRRHHARAGRPRPLLRQPRRHSA
ncbi:alpha/beta fold hydrolase [Streptomyces flaveolus]|uniref:alpha/beta fold hydrolase n=1 Tax=Streptomyces flaveolus TaxID=67297 RepID=UPI0033C5659F